MWCLFVVNSHNPHFLKCLKYNSLTCGGITFGFAWIPSIRHLETLCRLTAVEHQTCCGRKSQTEHTFATKDYIEREDRSQVDCPSPSASWPSSSSSSSHPLHCRCCCRLHCKHQLCCFLSHFSCYHLYLHHGSHLHLCLAATSLGVNTSCSVIPFKHVRCL